MSSSDERNIITQIKKKLMHDELQLKHFDKQAKKAADRIKKNDEKLKHYGAQIKATTDTVGKIKTVVEKQQANILDTIDYIDNYLHDLSTSDKEKEKLMLLKKSIIANNRTIKHHLETILRGE